MPKPKPLASIDYDTLMHWLVEHQSDMLVAFKPSRLDLAARIKLCDQSMNILARRLSLAGVTLLDNNVAVLTKPSDLGKPA